MSAPTEIAAGLAWFPLLAELAAKATIFLLMTAAAAAMLRGFSAAVRHLVWCIGIASVLVLPLFSVLVPAWELPLLPASAATSLAAYQPPVGGQRVGTESPSAPVGSPSAAGTYSEVVLSEEAQPVSGGWLGRAVAMVMISGMLLGLLWLAAGFWGAARIGRSAQVVRDPQWLGVAQEMSDRLALRRPVLLLQSRGVAMPATWGLIWPSVVLPATADRWSKERRRAVLAHELGHVKRFDCLTQTLAHITCVLFWWHPAVWYAARRLRVERERACDDLVLLAGARASDYAMHLLEIARADRVQRLASPALVSMAKPSQLESRLLSVLDEARPRSMPSLRASLLAVLIGIGLVGPLSAMRPGERAAGSDYVQDVIAAPAAVPAMPDSRAAEGVTPPARSETIAMSATGITRAGLEADLPTEPRGASVDTPRFDARGTAGDEGLSVDQLIERRIHRVTPEFVRELEALGYRGLTHRQLVEARIHGVTPAFIREMRAAGYGDLTHRQLVEMRIHRVTPAFVREMEALGYRDLTVRELVEMRIHGVTPDFVRQMRDIGLGDLSREMLVRLRISGVYGDLIESRQRTQTPNRR